MDHNEIKTLSGDVPDLMYISWEVMNTCNYACSYCSPSLHRGDNPMPDYTDSLEFFKYIDENIYNGPKMLSMVGGEPTLWPKLFDFLEKLSANYHTEITTNGSRTIRWWKMLTERNTRLNRVNISVHLEYADKEHILNVCKIIEEYFQVTVMIMFDLDYINKAIDIAEALKDSNLKISCRFKPIVLKKTKSNQKYSSNYLDEHREIIKKYNFNNCKRINIKLPSGYIVNGIYKPLSWGQQLISSNQHSFTGMFCEAGVKRLHIDFRGNVYPATCTTGYNNLLGKIKDKKIEKITGLICQSKFCACVPDTRIPKWKIENEQ